MCKLQLEAWEELTDLSPKKRGIFIALNLPDNDETKIKEKVFESLSLDKLKNEQGLKALIGFMDKYLKKDSLEESWTRFEQFEDFRRTTGESVSTFITDFDRRYERVKAKGMKLPDNLLAFKLLKSANITREERLLVMTGINLTDGAEMYEDAKRSLKKFTGEAMCGGGVSGG